MDGSAIREIEALSQRAQGDRSIDPETNERLRVVKADEKLESLEPYARQRFRFRGVYRTPLFAEFGHYTTRRVGAIRDVLSGTDERPVQPFRAPVFINHEKMAAVSFFNLGDHTNPGHGDDRAELVLERTAAYIAVLNVNGKPQSQREASEWLESWAGNLNVADAVPVGPLDNVTMHSDPRAAIRAIRHLRVVEVKDNATQLSDHAQRRTAMEEVEASAGGTQSLPVCFAFECEPYVGFERLRLFLRVTILPPGPTGPQYAQGKSEPKVLLSIVGLEAAVESLAAQFQTRLRHVLGDLADVSIGTFTP